MKQMSSCLDLDSIPKMHDYYIYVHVILFSKSEIGNSSGAGRFGKYTPVFSVAERKRP